MNQACQGDELKTESPEIAETIQSSLTQDYNLPNFFLDLKFFIEYLVRMFKSILKDRSAPFPYKCHFSAKRRLKGFNT